MGTRRGIIFCVFGGRAASVDRKLKGRFGRKPIRAMYEKRGSERAGTRRAKNKKENAVGGGARPGFCRGVSNPNKKKKRKRSSLP